MGEHWDKASICLHSCGFTLCTHMFHNIFMWLKFSCTYKGTEPNSRGWRNWVIVSPTIPWLCHNRILMDFPGVLTLACSRVLGFDMDLINIFPDLWNWLCYRHCDKAPLPPKITKTKTEYSFHNICMLKNWNECVYIQNHTNIYS